MAKKIIGFSSEEAFHRVRDTVNKVRKQRRKGAQRRRQSPVVRGDQIYFGKLNGEIGGLSDTADVSKYTSIIRDTDKDFTVENLSDFHGEEGDWCLFFKLGSGTQWYCVPLQHPLARGFLGKTDENIAIDTDGDVSVYTGSLGAETDSGETVNAFSKFATIPTDTWVWCERNDAGLYYIVSARCE